MKKLDICKIKRHFGDKISIFILSYADKVLKRVRTCAFSGGYFPLVMDFEQILRNDGKVNSWSGGDYSQCGQDMFIDFLFGNKSDGFFIDIGGNDPVKINNTYFFEKKAGVVLRSSPCRNIKLSGSRRG